MAEIGGQRGDVLVYVSPGALPADQGFDSKAVSQIMDPRVHGRGADVHGDSDLPEDPAHAVAVQCCASAGEKERPGAGPGAEPVALGNVARQRLGDAWVQRHQPGAIEFRFPDRDDPCFKVDVVAQQPDCLADPHA